MNKNQELRIIMWVIAAMALLSTLSVVVPKAFADDDQGVTLLAAVARLAQEGAYVSMVPPETQLTWSWTAPTTGAPVVDYVGELEVNGEVSTHDLGVNTYWEMDYPDEDETDIRLRVAGVDDQERQGMWSEWSEVYHDSGRPGAPGVPGGSVGVR